MYQAPEQLIAFNKANLELASRFAGIALEGAERMLDLQLKVAREAFSDTLESAKAIAAAKDFQQLAALKDSLAQPTLEKAAEYAKSVYDVAASTQAELGKLIEEQFTSFNKEIVAALDKLVKTAPAGSEVGIAAVKSAIAAVNSAYENLAKVAKQLAEATQSNLDAVARQAVGGAAKKAKK